MADFMFQAIETLQWTAKLLALEEQQFGWINEEITKNKIEKLEWKMGEQRDFENATLTLRKILSYRLKNFRRLEN